MHGGLRRRAEGQGLEVKSRGAGGTQGVLSLRGFKGLRPLKIPKGEGRVLVFSLVLV